MVSSPFAVGGGKHSEIGTRLSFGRSTIDNGLEAATPEFAEALDIARQVRVIVPPRLVLRQLDLLHRRVEALARELRLLHRVGEIDHVLLGRAHVVLRPQPPTRIRMAGDHPVPVERQHSIERVEEVGQEAVGEVAELEALDGDEVHREEQLPSATASPASCQSGSGPRSAARAACLRAR
jgi:hypothetical protein